MVRASEHFGHPPELCDSGDVPALWPHPILSTGMRILVTLLLDTLPMLGNVLALCFFVFFIFGIVGVQLWAGLLRNRCFMGEDVRM
ncbi:Voltage-dependent T-type calcium channel subunit alpha-1G [Goodea atripinnis]|uniref:Voltage-dependent T-type calcium channel subunit alpha-1G n=1 Tax=Goodea atripinnis TaxID=208336 RepID=A0ABV0MYZ6_9TELE